MAPWSGPSELARYRVGLAVELMMVALHRSVGYRPTCICGVSGADSKKPLLGGGGAALHPFASPANLMSLAAEFHKSVIGPPPPTAAFPYPPHLAAAAAAAAAAAGPFAAFMPLAAHPGMMNLVQPNHLLRPADHVTSRAGPEVTSSRDLS